MDVVALFIGFIVVLLGSIALYINRPQWFMLSYVTLSKSNRLLLALALSLSICVPLVYTASLVWLLMFVPLFLTNYVAMSRQKRLAIVRIRV